MRKRERENPCGICGHYHKYEEGEVCGICGHRMPVGVEKSLIQISAFPSEILPEFLYLGSYDNASRSELLKTLGISRVLNTVPACQNLYKNSFTYHCLPDSPTLAFDDAVEFLEQCEQDKARVLVHCMSGKNRSPAVVMAYLVKSRKWTLDQSYQWVKEHSPPVDINPGVMQQLQEYAQKIQAALESSGGSGAPPPISGGGAPFSFGFTNTTNVPLALPAFNTAATPFIFARADIPSPNKFAFGAAADAHQNLVSSAPNSVNPNATDVSMDGS